MKVTLGYEWQAADHIVPENAQIGDTYEFHATAIIGQLEDRLQIVEPKHERRCTLWLENMTIRRTPKDNPST